MYIGWGNTYKLLYELKMSGDFQKKNYFFTQNGIIYGESEGTIIFGKVLDSCKS